MALAEETPPFLLRKPPVADLAPVFSDANPGSPVQPAKHATSPYSPAANGRLEAARAKCMYLINHEFRALQLDRQMATMSVFDLIDHCAALFEKLAAAKDSDIDELFRLYVRSFLIFNYFVNTFIMLHFNGFARFMESAHQDFIIYLNLYNFYRCDDIVGPHAFHVPPPTVRAWTIEYLVSKNLLTFDVDLLYAWLDLYIEYLKNKEAAHADPAAPSTNASGLLLARGPQSPRSGHAMPRQAGNDDVLSDFNSRFPDLPLQLPPSLDPAKAPYPVSDPARDDAVLPYPIGSGNQPLKTDAISLAKARVLLLLPAPVAAHALPVTSHLPYGWDHVPPSNSAFPTTHGSSPGLALNTAARSGIPKHGSELRLSQAQPLYATPGLLDTLYAIPGQLGTLYPLDPHKGQRNAINHHPGQALEYTPTFNGSYLRASHNTPPRQQQNLQHQHIPQNPQNFQPLPQHHSQQSLQHRPYNRSGSQHHHEKQKANTRKVFAICGLKNLGSSCYINLTVQVLAGLEKFETLLLQRKKKPNPQPLTDATAGLLTTFNANGGANIAPTKFLRVLSSLKPDFNVPFEQQDAQEFLLFLLDKLHEEMAIKPQGDPVDYLSKWNITVNPRDTDDYLKWYKDLVDHEGESPINDTFQGHVQSKLVCNKCGHRSVSYSPFTILSLPIPAGNNQTVDLTDCLRYFTQDEVLAGENAWNCPKCNKSSGNDNPIDVVFQPKRGLFRLKRSKSPAKRGQSTQVYANKSTSISIKQLSFIKLPPVMFIHLSRFSMANVTDKLNTTIVYPLRLKFNHLGHDIYYSLTGLINHYGSLKSGHYTSLVNKAPVDGAYRDPLLDPIWCYFDDDHVRFNVQHGNVHSNDYNKLHSRDVYVLCYERK
ncbi:cysteine proteinase [Metschnikowia bicuspidata var. bicuspidata NRRL YB-4993]|uniref:ubiquitinyl hydrolase 1 n=1 Tax=Metschnikowia bicuspidata var. bicuspidata NRRL YB-4993 TaxID=869754 RepID=A0A1A0HGQ4_9ASCO|nr:cysteine proteinase [Metschnikowia bicuspidata var. bicuspidata NRRL YB-4993]OBA23170.1 cysteine proteinase [Metschnikowia bicuspidata var. bicuspidata NRRL YB-4993]